MAEEQITPSSSAAEVESGVADAAGAISAGVATIASIIASAEQNPCNQEPQLLTKLSVAQFQLNQMLMGVRMWSVRNYEAVDNSIRNWGKFTATYDAAGSQGFAEFLALNNYIEPFWQTFVSSQLQAGRGFIEPSTVNSGDIVLGGPINPANPGRLGRPGAYVTASGEIRGSRINQAWHDWVARQRRQVWAASTFRPNWRERLYAWTGYDNWRPGKKFKPGYLVAQSIQGVQQIEDAYNRASEECAAQRDVQRSIATSQQEQASDWAKGQLGLAAGAQQLEAAGLQTELEKEKLQQETIQRGLLVAAALGAAFIGFK